MTTSVNFPPRQIPAKSNLALSPSPVWLLVAIFAFSLLLRLIHLDELKSTPQPADLDIRLYDTIARNILAGDWVGGQEAKYATTTLYAYLLALIYALFGVSEFPVRAVQLLLGACTPVLVYLAGRRIFDNKTGVVASVLAALYGPPMFYEGTLGNAGLLVFLTSLAIVALLWAEKRGTVGAWLMAGMAVAFLPLFRPNTLLFLPFSYLWIVMVSRRLGAGRVARNIGAFIVGGVIICAPMLARYGYAVRAGATSSLAGLHFYIGNHPHATGSYVSVPGVRPQPEGHVEDATAVAEREVGRSLTPAEVSRYWFTKGLGFIWAEPLAALQLTGRKLLLALSDTEIHVPGHDYLAWRASTALKLPLLTMGIVAPLALFGLFLSLRRSRQALLLHLFFSSYTASLCLFFVTGRYRLPLIPVLILYAAFATVWLSEVWQHNSRRCVAAAVAILLVFFALPRFDGLRAQSYEPPQQFDNCIVITDRSGFTEEEVNGIITKAKEILKPANVIIRKKIFVEINEPCEQVEFKSFLELIDEHGTTRRIKGAAAINAHQGPRTLIKIGRNVVTECGGGKPGKSLTGAQIDLVGRVLAHEIGHAKSLDQDPVAGNSLMSDCAPVGTLTDEQKQKLQNGKLSTKLPDLALMPKLDPENKTFELTNETKIDVNDLRLEFSCPNPKCLLAVVDKGEFDDAAVRPDAAKVGLLAYHMIANGSSVTVKIKGPKGFKLKSCNWSKNNELITVGCKVPKQ